MSTFDQTARLASKLDGAGFYAWVLSRVGAPDGLRFDRWEDARRLAVVPGLERIDDVVAVLKDAARPDENLYLITEFETEPRRHVFKRLGIYALLMSIELSPGPGPEEEPPVVACVLNLTGTRPRTGLRVGLSAGVGNVTVEPWVVNFADQDAAATLAAVAAGQAARCLLPWVPLMSGGGERDLIERWKEVAAQEADLDLRGTYGTLALTFAELTLAFVNWQQALEGWAMRESQVVLGFKREGAIEGEVKARRDDLLKFIRATLADPVPEMVRAAVEGTNDPQILCRWIDLVLASDSLDAFCAAIASPR